MNKILITILGLLLLAGGAYKYDKDKDDDKGDRIDLSQPAPAWFDAPAYLIVNSDVEKAGIGAWQHYLESGQFEPHRPPYFGRPVGQSDTGNQDKPTSGVAQPPVERIIYIDDTPLSAEKDVDGDPNGFQDSTFVLALSAHYNVRPMAIGVTANSDGVDGHVMKDMVALSGLEIPVLRGHWKYGAGKSELCDFIVAESKKGKLKIAVGGTVGDIACAINSGAHTHNITVYGTLLRTYNAKQDVKSYNIVKSKVKTIEIDDVGYKAMLKPRPGLYSQPKTMFNKHKDLPLWDYIDRGWIKNVNAQYNKGRVGYANPLTLSDALNFARAMGRTWKDYNGVYGDIDKGLTKLKKYPSAKNNAPRLEHRPKRAAYTKAMYKGQHKTLGTADPMKWPRTSTITRLSFGKNSSVMDHTKINSWRHIRHPNGKDVNANISVLAFDGKGWVMYASEYSSKGRSKRPFGYQRMSYQSSGQFVPDIRRGDQVGIVVHGITRNGLSNVRERTDLKWVTIK